MAYLFHPSGSLSYHLRAWRWRRSLWASFQAELGGWLEDWQPRPSHLVLIGPSAGYFLRADFLARFDRISVLEPDPLARWLLQRRFPEIAFSWRDSAYLPQTGGPDRLAAEFPDAAFLFCNLLGQELQGQASDFDRRAFLSRLESALAGRSWASWHDLVSTARAPDVHLHLDHLLPLERVLAHYWQGGSLELVDHETAGLCPGCSRRYAFWRLSPGKFHLIEWIATPRT